MGDAKQKRKRIELSLEKRIEIIDHYDREGGTLKQTADKFGIHKSTMHFILKNREKIKQVSLCNKDVKRHRMRNSNYEQMEKELFNYVAYCECSGIDISFSKLRLKAQELADKCGLVNFNSNPGWISRFQKRHRLPPDGGGQRHITTSCTRDPKKWLSSVLELAIDYHLDNIFNVDETGLFYNLPQTNDEEMYDSTKCASGEDSKNRLTVLLACNASGTERIKPLIIGTEEIDAGYRSSEKSQPHIYQVNENAWMTRTSFYYWLQEFNDNMAKTNRVILLIMDRSPPHAIENMTLSHIKILYIPPNISLKQPLECGIVRSFKSFFRYRWIPQSAAVIGADNFKPLRLDEAIHYIEESWHEVPEGVIRNSWRRSGVLSELISDDVEDVNDVDPFILDIVPEDLIDFDNSLCVCPPMDDSLPADNEMIEVITLTEDDCVDAINENNVEEEYYEIEMIKDVENDDLDLDKCEVVSVEPTEDKIRHLKRERVSEMTAEETKNSAKQIKIDQRDWKHLLRKKATKVENVISESNKIKRGKQNKNESTNEQLKIKEEQQKSRVAVTLNKSAEKAKIKEPTQEVRKVKNASHVELKADEHNDEQSIEEVESEQEQDQVIKQPKTPFEIFAAVETIEQFLTDEQFPPEQLALFTQFKEKIACHCMSKISKEMKTGQKKKSI